MHVGIVNEGWSCADPFVITRAGAVTRRFYPQITQITTRCRYLTTRHTAVELARPASYP